MRAIPRQGGLFTALGCWLLVKVDSPAPLVAFVPGLFMLAARAVLMYL